MSPCLQPCLIKLAALRCHSVTQAWGGGAFCEEFANGLPSEPTSCLVPYGSVAGPQLNTQVNPGSGAVSAGASWPAECLCGVPQSLDLLPESVQQANRLPGALGCHLAVRALRPAPKSALAPALCLQVPPASM